MIKYIIIRYYNDSGGAPYVRIVSNESDLLHAVLADTDMAGDGTVIYRVSVLDECSYIDRIYPTGKET